MCMGEKNGGQTGNQLVLSAGAQQEIVTLNVRLNDLINQFNAVIAVLGVENQQLRDKLVELQDSVGVKGKAA